MIYLTHEIKKKKVKHVLQNQNNKSKPDKIDSNDWRFQKNLKGLNIRKPATRALGANFFP